MERHWERVEKKYFLYIFFCVHWCFSVGDKWGHEKIGFGVEMEKNKEQGVNFYLLAWIGCTFCYRLEKMAFYTQILRNIFYLFFFIKLASCCCWSFFLKQCNWIKLIEILRKFDYLVTFNLKTLSQFVWVCSLEYSENILKEVIFCLSADF